MTRKMAVLGIVALLAALLSASRAEAAVIDPATRTVDTTQFHIVWSGTDPEEVLDLQWDGSANLTNTGVQCADGSDLEYFGNAWAAADSPDFVPLVGWGTTGTWQSPGHNQVKVNSSSAGCYGSAEIAVETRYHFFDNGPAANKFQAQRKFSFGATPFEQDFRPYIARLGPRSTFSQVLHPNAAGTALLTENDSAGTCDLGCQVADWNGTWFAIHDPVGGSGMIVKRVTSPYAVKLWVDNDSASDTNSSSVLLLEPNGGFAGNVVEVESFCFYDSASWTPGLALPPGC